MTVERKSGILGERAERVAHIARQIAQRVDPAGIHTDSGGFGGQRHVAEIFERRQCAVPIAAVGDSFVLGDGEVRADLAIELVVVRPSLLPPGAH